MAKRGVALLYCAGIPDPEVPESRFHVEHCPVHPPPPAKAAFFNQLVDAWIDNLDREGLRQLGQ
jgi:hypothetical protein